MNKTNMKNKVYAIMKDGSEHSLPSTFDNLHKLTLPNPGNKKDGGWYFTNPHMMKLAAKTLGVSARTVKCVSSVPAFPNN